MNQGLYEELVTKLINYKINELDKDTFYIKKTSIDKAEAAQLLSQHIGKTIQQAFNLILLKIYSSSCGIGSSFMNASNEPIEAKSILIVE